VTNEEILGGEVGYTKVAGSMA